MTVSLAPFGLFIDEVKSLSSQFVKLLYSHTLREGTLRLLLPTPTMTMSKGMVLCLCMFMLSGLLTSYTDAKAISYGAIGNGNPISCSKRGGAQKNCQAGAPANPYSRGCGKGTKCRHG
ncbi:hypothetical protein RGQ29_018340 [Quercus rubra]|uniref:Rapid ALkalinization Factor n=1 Tax=Quercus rubra TaxID=3512 RepID=A0AAN7FNL8_QUERU|nr:hypothetical protein RGQ29_018340 [Quercus rubra]